MLDLLAALPHVYMAAGAAPTSMSALQSDTTNFLNAGSNWIMGVGGAGGGTMLGYHSLMKVVNDDPQTVAHHTQSQKKVMVGSVAVMIAGGLVKILTGFF